jgi:outer membrane biosynthesis protein TonB
MRRWAWAGLSSLVLHVVGLGLFGALVPRPQAAGGVRTDFNVSYFSPAGAKRSQETVSSGVKKARRREMPEATRESSGVASAIEASLERAEPFLGEPGGQGAPGHGGGTQAADLTPLIQRLSESARACYPPGARRFGLTGLAQVSFCLSGDDVLEAVTLEKTSGHVLLDKAATGCVLDRARPLVAPKGCYSVPVRFVSR